MAAKLRPQVIPPRPDSSADARAAKALGRQLQRLVSRRLHFGYEGSVICREIPDQSSFVVGFVAPRTPWQAA